MKKESPHLAQETKITWLQNPNQFPYLRERVERLAFRSRFPLRRYQGTSYFKLVGYSEISATAESINSGFYRRIWYLMKPNDPFDKSSPCEAVKPSTIKPRASAEEGRE